MINEKLYSKHLPFPNKPDRQVWIYVPKHNESDRLPVVYMSDGQNLFDEKSTPHGSWRVADAVKAEIKNGSKGAVIVGIDNGNVWRENELTPKSIGRLNLDGEEFLTPLDDEVIENLKKLNEEFSETFTGADGEIFDSFLLDTVMPYVESNFPVSTKREETAFCGSSMGGLFAFYTTLKNNDRFSFSGVFSPAFLLYSEQTIVDFAMNTKGNLPYLYIYTGCGDKLEEIIGATTNTVYDMLENYGYPYDRQSIVTMPENMHNEKFWSQIYPDFLHTFLNRTSL